MHEKRKSVQQNPSTIKRKQIDRALYNIIVYNKIDKIIPSKNQEANIKKADTDRTDSTNVADSNEYENESHIFKDNRMLYNLLFYVLENKVFEYENEMTGEAVKIINEIKKDFSKYKDVNKEVDWGTENINILKECENKQNDTTNKENIRHEHNIYADNKTKAINNLEIDDQEKENDCNKEFECKNERDFEENKIKNFANDKINDINMCNVNTACIENNYDSFYNKNDNKEFMNKICLLKELFSSDLRLKIEIQNNEIQKLKLDVEKCKQNEQAMIEEEKKKEQEINIGIVAENEYLKSEVEGLKTVCQKLEATNSEIISDKIYDRKIFIRDLGDIKNKYDLLCKKKNDEIAKLLTRNKTLEDDLLECEIKYKVKNDREEQYYYVLKSIQEIENLFKLLYTRATSLDVNTKENKILYDEIIELTKLYEEALTKNKNLINQLKEKKMVIEENEIVIRKLKHKLEETTEPVDFIKKETVNCECKIDLERVKCDLAERKGAAAFHKRNAEKLIVEVQAFTKKAEYFEKIYNETKQKMYNLKNKNEESEISTDLENYRRLLRCSACDKNYKNTIILKCMHVFCRECIDNRIRTRNRYCPNCNENFHTADVKRIFL